MLQRRSVFGLDPWFLSVSLAVWLRVSHGTCYITWGVGISGWGISVFAEGFQQTSLTVSKQIQRPVLLCNECLTVSWLETSARGTSGSLVTITRKYCFWMHSAFVIEESHDKTTKQKWKQLNLFFLWALWHLGNLGKTKSHILRCFDQDSYAKTNSAAIEKQSFYVLVHLPRIT